MRDCSLLEGRYFEWALDSAVDTLSSLDHACVSRDFKAIPALIVNLFEINAILSCKLKKIT